MAKKGTNKYNTYLSVNYESSKGYYYVEKQADGRYKHILFPTFNEAIHTLIISCTNLRKKRDEYTSTTLSK